MDFHQLVKTVVGDILDCPKKDNIGRGVLVSRRASAWPVRQKTSERKVEQQCNWSLFEFLFSG